MTQPMYSRSDILLAVQGSLIGEVFPRLLAVDVSWDVKSLELKCFVSSELDDDDQEAISSIEAELAAHLPEAEIETRVLIGDPSKSDRGQVCAFAARRKGKREV